jgi:UDP-N-acetylmuramoyl-tripeptide--D-alanyl-D-alanine ligase
MIKISAGEFAKVVSGSLHEIDSQMTINQSPVINSKKASKDNFFVAFVGSQVDGHDYVKEAIELGAKFALVSKSV